MGAAMDASRKRKERDRSGSDGGTTTVFGDGGGRDKSPENGSDSGSDGGGDGGGGGGD
jgi:hypothetical protein